MSDTLGTTPSKNDANKQFTLMALSGTIGATYGTAVPVPLTATADGQLRVQTTVDLSGTISRINTVGTLELGTVDTELPAAGTLSDSLSNPVTPMAGAALLGWDTTQWSRIRQGIGDGAPATGMLNIVPMVFNGSTYDRLRGNTSGLTVKEDLTPVKTIVNYGTVIAGTAETTLLSAQGSGTAIYITYFKIQNKGTASADCYLGFGTAQTNGATLIDNGNYSAGGGVAIPLQVPNNGGVTNLALLFQNVTGGTAAVNIQYYVE